MTLCWSDYRTRACGVAPLAPLAVFACVVLLVRMFFELLDALTSDDRERVVLRILLNIIPGIFALFALVGLGLRSPVLARAGGFATWPVILALFLSLGMRWWTLLSRDVTSTLVEEHDKSHRHADWKPTDAEWNRLWLLTLLDVLLILGLIYVSSLFKRIARLYRAGGDPWHVHQPRVTTDTIQDRHIIVEDSYGPNTHQAVPVAIPPVAAGVDQIVEPIFQQS